VQVQVPVDVGVQMKSRSASEVHRSVQSMRSYAFPPAPYAANSNKQTSAAPPTATGRIAADITAGSRRTFPILHTGPGDAPPPKKNCPFPWGSRIRALNKHMVRWATRVHTPNCISIGSSVLAQLILCPTDTYKVGQKGGTNSCPKFCRILTDLQIFFTGRIPGKFAVNSLLKIPPLIAHVPRYLVNH